jgi:hypothetical protein
MARVVGKDETAKYRAVLKRKRVRRMVDIGVYSLEC